VRIIHEMATAEQFEGEYSSEDLEEILRMEQEALGIPSSSDNNTNNNDNNNNTSDENEADALPIISGGDVEMELGKNLCSFVLSFVCLFVPLIMYLFICIITIRIVVVVVVVVIVIIIIIIIITDVGAEQVGGASSDTARHPLSQNGEQTHKQARTQARTHTHVRRCTHRYPYTCIHVLNC
jgi:VIT1/CCC1 family predicted Fe2+/Mn2+ transporter